MRRQHSRRFSRKVKSDRYFMQATLWCVFPAPNRQKLFVKRCIIACSVSCRTYLFVIFLKDLKYVNILLFAGLACAWSRAEISAGDQHHEIVLMSSK